MFEIRACLKLTVRLHALFGVFPAGYCVIMYLLGVGDRHLDNLLLSPNGKYHSISKWKTEPVVLCFNLV